MPAGQRKRSASVDIYTALMALAVVALGAACYAMYTAGSKVGVNGSPFGLQTPGSIKLPTANAK
jgi:hypothetical protein